MSVVTKSAAAIVSNDYGARHLEQDRVCLGQAAEVGPAIPNLPARETFASFSAGPGSTVLLPLPWCARPAVLVDAHDAPRPYGY